jgi:TPR repeat protein
MTVTGPSQFLQQEKKGPLRLLLDLHATNSTFRGFVEFAVIGAIVLFFIHGMQVVPEFGAGSAHPTSAKISIQDVKDQGDVARLARRNSTMVPRLNELGLDEHYFAGDAEPLRTVLTEAWRAYRGKAPRKALELLQTAKPDDPHVLLIRGLATMADPQDGSLRSGALYVEEAADKGDVKSMALLGVLHINGTPGIQNDLEKGQKLILAAAARGDVDASRIAGQGFLSGWMGSIDAGRAAKYFRFAADHDDAKASLFLADLYFTGRGVAKDDLEGDRLAEKSASQGYREAQTLIGLRRMQAYAAEISDDPSEALKWLDRAAQQNEPTALQSLANYYINLAAKSGKVDIPKGIELLKRCVEQSGNPGCAMSYADILDDGLGGRDVKAAYAMYLLASRDGSNSKAQRRLAELSKELSTQDLLQIQIDLAKYPLEPLLR